MSTEWQPNICFDGSVVHENEMRRMDEKTRASRLIFLYTQPPFTA